ncbi:hypothetical protein CU098_009745, partial [Rhizopus stolonifer]
LEARKSAAANNPSAPVPVARRAPPAPGPKPVIPAKPSSMSKPAIPSRPGGAPTPAPRAPPRNANGTPSNAAASLADALRARRQQAPSHHDDDDDEW